MPDLMLRDEAQLAGLDALERADRAVRRSSSPRRAWQATWPKLAAVGPEAPQLRQDGCQGGH